MKLVMIYGGLLDAEGERLTVGGVQTYMLALGSLSRALGWQPMMFQAANRPFERNVQDVTVVGVPGVKATEQRVGAVLHEVYERQLAGQEYLVVVGDFRMLVPSPGSRHIALQHGVNWDSPERRAQHRGRLGSGVVAHHLRLLWETRYLVNSFNRWQHRVCVDYNFLNWYRTAATRPMAGNTWVIPNFTHVAAEQELRRRDRPGPVRVLFARRFQPRRGAMLFAQVVQSLLQEFDALRVTFAGEGPDETELKSMFAGEPRVQFTRFEPQESMAVHLEHDIAVIPSLYSEGTAFAVAEAMGAGCAVVATNIGGVTNMIIDGYNGLLVMPEAAALRQALARVIGDGQLRSSLSERGYDTARHAFAADRWQARWRAVLEQVAGQ